MLKVKRVSNRHNDTILKIQSGPLCSDQANVCQDQKVCKLFRIFQIVMRKLFDTFLKRLLTVCIAYKNVWSTDLRGERERKFGDNLEISETWRCISTLPTRMLQILRSRPKQKQHKFKFWPQCLKFFCPVPQCSSHVWYVFEADLHFLICCLLPFQGFKCHHDRLAAYTNHCLEHSFHGIGYRGKNKA